MPSTETLHTLMISLLVIGFSWLVRFTLQLRSEVRELKLQLERNKPTLLETSQSEQDN